MKINDTTSSENGIYYRLISLWVIAEAFLGGIIHGLKIPISGLVVGSCAVVCICLMAHFVGSAQAILRATIIVCIFKLMLSPQAPPTAYIAVVFQGLLGALLLKKGRWLLPLCILFGWLALTESGLQRILVFTLIYGQDMWKLITESIQKLFSLAPSTPISQLLILGYIGLHMLVGLLAGRLGFILSKKVTDWSTQPQISKLEIATHEKNYLTLFQKKAHSKWNSWLLLIFIGLTILWMQSIIQPDAPWFKPGLVTGILLRSTLIILFWFTCVRPVFESYMKRWGQQQRTKYQRDITAILLVLPKTIAYVRAGWQAARLQSKPGILLFIKIVLVHTLILDRDES